MTAQVAPESAEGVAEPAVPGGDVVEDSKKMAEGESPVL